MSKYLKLTQALGKKLQAAGYSIPEIHRAVDAYEAKLIQEDADRAAFNEQAPEGITDAELRGLNFERAIEGKAPLIDPTKVKADRTLGMSQAEIDRVNFDRAVDGKKPMTADEIAHMATSRAMGPVDAPLTERAPKGMHAKQVAAINLDRACSGNPTKLVPFDEWEEE